MEIKNHIFFSPINWDDLINKKITPPFNPNVVRITSNYRVHGECLFTPCLCGVPGARGKWPNGCVWGMQLSFPCVCLNKVKNRW